MPQRIPQAFINAELGATRLLARHHKLSMNYFMKTTAHRQHRYNVLTMKAMLSSQMPTKWELGFRIIVSSLLHEEINMPPRLSSTNESRDFCTGNVNLMNLDDREEMVFQTNLNDLRSLHMYTEVRDSQPISKEYAWAKTHIGRPSHKQLQLYLDKWRCKHNTTKLKLLARANSMMLKGQRRRLFNLDVHDGECSLCDSNVQQTLAHLTCSCSGTEDIRSRLYQSVMSHLNPHNQHPGQIDDLLQTFQYDAFNDLNKLYVLLGKPTGLRSTDDKIDSSFRKFLYRLNRKLDL